MNYIIELTATYKKFKITLHSVVPLTFQILFFCTQFGMRFKIFPNPGTSAVVGASNETKFTSRKSQKARIMINSFPKVTWLNAFLFFSIFFSNSTLLRTTFNIVLSVLP